MALEPFDPLLPRIRRGKAIPFAFVLDRLEPLAPYTRPMFGCTAVYVEDRIVLVLRERGDSDDGVWVVFQPERESEVLALLPRLRDIDRFAGKVRGWKKLAASSDELEGDVERVCRHLLAGDARFGKVPVSRRPSSAARKRKAKTRGVRGAGRRGPKQ